MQLEISGKRNRLRACLPAALGSARCIQLASKYKFFKAGDSRDVKLIF